MELGTVALRACCLCPRGCGVDRAMRGGFCRIDGDLHVATVCWHRGEEPVLGGEAGVLNVFFAHCNLSCVFCQNHQISRNGEPLDGGESVEGLVERLFGLVSGRERPTIGFVSPTPYAWSIPAIVEGLRGKGVEATYVYNSNGYDAPWVIDALSPYVDIFLPDYKYGGNALGRELSGAKDYADAALEAIQRMRKHKGDGLELDEAGVARRGVIVRHLVLPGMVENTRSALTNLALEVSPRLHLSLMAQYTPTASVSNHPLLHRSLTAEEYVEACSWAASLGFTKGWQQELASSRNYSPDFTRANPFG